MLHVFQYMHPGGWINWLNTQTLYIADILIHLMREPP